MSAGLRDASTPVVVGVACRRFRDGAFTDIQDDLAVEIGIEVSCGPGPARRLYAAPLDLPVLALGHAWLEMCPPGFSPVAVARDGGTWAAKTPESPETIRRFVFELVPGRETVLSGPECPGSLTPQKVVEHMRRFIAAPGLWEDTGCFHRGGVLDPATGDFLFLAEDIGRHNCLDRLGGRALLAKTSLAGLVLFLSARVTASMCDKALRAGFTCIVSRSAVTTEAVRLAREGGLALAGFAREAENRFTVFCDPSGRFSK
ncbi:formate dehydrogenase accessory sulfurtransferase FdhD [Desulfolutivibrio sulfoxidireducens]|uniref:formate dehydrogenase accessory sulfurtransferase FdhD n=1 Tax=Desulfolutivibrio sulfoxidireducens TaxID=2773299 RepID=UPI00159D15FB|nr:formate dehydrogenase accessory sulfurtransferase FdhD [Desulfolutivibrio sulfoxidireducens]QLA16341.1 fatty-acid--CoA ligase [Desulfolutivibrio sulfoxidireducens]QLA19768.1 fatty-acid--CoA ligase [Desulfolutivibrio sulfoxidireducens]